MESGRSSLAPLGILMGNNSKVHTNPSPLQCRKLFKMAMHGALIFSESWNLRQKRRYTAIGLTIADSRQGGG